MGDMENEREALAATLKQALIDNNTTLDGISDITKVPRSTLQALMGEPISSMLPERVYMRGHLGVVAAQLGLDREKMNEMFDQAYARGEVTSSAQSSRSHIGAASLVVMVGLGGMAVLAVVLAFTQTVG
jgi:cytoskeletal protein RodZ